MSKRLVASRMIVTAMVVLPAAAVAQDWVPGTEIVAQSVVVETNGIANTV